MTAMAFQSTRPHGARRGNGMMTQPALLFQSTRPHGARLTTHNLFTAKHFLKAFHEPDNKLTKPNASLAREILQPPFFQYL